MARDWGPNVRFPPPLLFIAGFLIGLWLDASVREIVIFGPAGAPVWAQIAGMVVFVFGIALAMWGFMTFRLAMTPIVTISPATTLVTHGPYRFSRNPMYLGLTLAYVGLAITLNTVWPLLLLPIAVGLLFTLVIKSEERYLSQKFGEAYEAYRRRVRRWF